MKPVGNLSVSELVIREAIITLKAAGYTVLNLPKTMPLVEYRKELGLRANTLSPLLNHPSCPKFNAVRGARNRIYTIEPTEELTAFLLSYTPRTKK